MILACISQFIFYDRIKWNQQQQRTYTHNRFSATSTTFRRPIKRNESWNKKKQQLNDTRINWEKKTVILHVMKSTEVSIRRHRTEASSHTVLTARLWLVCSAIGEKILSSADESTRKMLQTELCSFELFYILRSSSSSLKLAMSQLLLSKSIGYINDNDDIDHNDVDEDFSHN